MARTVSIGNQDFESIRKNNYFYIDKTDFIREWWESVRSGKDSAAEAKFGIIKESALFKAFFKGKINVDKHNRGVE